MLTSRLNIVQDRFASDPHYRWDLVVWIAAPSVYLTWRAVFVLIV